MDIKTLTEKVNALVALRTEVNAIDLTISQKRNAFERSIAKDLEKSAQAREACNALQEELVTALKDNNLKQWKTDKATVSKKSSVTYKVVDEKKVFKKLKALKLYDEYVKPTLIPQTKDLFEQQKFPGVEKVEKEFISVLTAKK